jgi:hypothetical protein
MAVIRGKVIPATEVRRRRGGAIAPGAVRIRRASASRSAVICRIAGRRRSASAGRPRRTVAVLETGVVRASKRLNGCASTVDSGLAIRIRHARSFISGHERIAGASMARAAPACDAMVLRRGRVPGQSGVVGIGRHACASQTAVEAWNLAIRNRERATKSARRRGWRADRDGNGLETAAVVHRRPERPSVSTIPTRDNCVRAKARRAVADLRHVTARWTIGRAVA